MKNKKLLIITACMLSVICPIIQTSYASSLPDVDDIFDMPPYCQSEHYQNQLKMIELENAKSEAIDKWHKEHPRDAIVTFNGTVTGACPLSFGEESDSDVFLSHIFENPILLADLCFGQPKVKHDKDDKKPYTIEKEQLNRKREQICQYIDNLITAKSTEIARLIRELTTQTKQVIGTVATTKQILEASTIPGFSYPADFVNAVIAVDQSATDFKTSEVQAAFSQFRWSLGTPYNLDETTFWNGTAAVGLRTPYSTTGSHTTIAGEIFCGRIYADMTKILCDIRALREEACALTLLKNEINQIVARLWPDQTQDLTINATCHNASDTLGYAMIIGISRMVDQTVKSTIEDIIANYAKLMAYDTTIGLQEALVLSMFGVKAERISTSENITGILANLQRELTPATRDNTSVAPPFLAARFTYNGAIIDKDVKHENYTKARTRTIGLFGQLLSAQFAQRQAQLDDAADVSELVTALEEYQTGMLAIDRDSFPATATNGQLVRTAQNKFLWYYNFQDLTVLGKWVISNIRVLTQRSNGVRLIVEGDRLDGIVLPARSPLTFPTEENLMNLRKKLGLVLATAVLSTGYVEARLDYTTLEGSQAEYKGKDGALLGLTAPGRDFEVKSDFGTTVEDKHKLAIQGIYTALNSFINKFAVSTKNFDAEAEASIKDGGAFAQRLAASAGSLSLLEAALIEATQNLTVFADASVKTSDPSKKTEVKKVSFAALKTFAAGLADPKFGGKKAPREIFEMIFEIENTTTGAFGDVEDAMRLIEEGVAAMDGTTKRVSEIEADIRADLKLGGDLATYPLPDTTEKVTITRAGATNKELVAQYKADHATLVSESATFMAEYAKIASESLELKTSKIQGIVDIAVQMGSLEILKNALEAARAFTSEVASAKTNAVPSQLAGVTNQTRGFLRGLGFKQTSMTEAEKAFTSYDRTASALPLITGDADEAKRVIEAISLSTTPGVSDLLSAISVAKHTPHKITVSTPSIGVTPPSLDLVTGITGTVGSRDKVAVSTLVPTPDKKGTRINPLSTSELTEVKTPGRYWVDKGISGGGFVIIELVEVK